MVTQYVYEFAEGNKDQRDLLGGKGANLAEMTRLGLPVPPGFTITTEACRSYLAAGHEPPELRVNVTAALRGLEDRLDRRLGDRHDPLLVSVRSGAKFSMPGMMETVLNIGLNDASVLGLAEASGDERFAWDSYRRLIMMFGKTVLLMDGDLFSSELDQAKVDKGVTSDVDLEAADLQALVQRYKDLVREHTGHDFPQHPREQLDLAIRAVFDSWNTDRARIYRRRERIPHGLGTAVNVCTMVFGNLGGNSGTGVAFTRDPASGRPGAYGDYLANAQGEDVVSGIRNTTTLDEMAVIDPKAHAELMADDASPGDALSRPVRHRVHHRARQAVDAADTRGQTYGCCGVPHRDPAHRRGADHPRRGAEQGQRATAGPADVSAVRCGRASGATHRRDGRVPGSSIGSRRLRLGHRGRVGSAR